MPRFYFNLCNGPEFTEDGEGGEFPDFAAAHQYAVVSLRDVTAGDLRMGDLNTAAFIEIEDEQHKLVKTVLFEDVVTLRKDQDARRRREGA